ncbi:MAG TPA: GNAT family N-acetyltransferase [Mucilaginibacter sp.]|jgi:ribosomal protein S18 acetylase RimI-like enzyme|nr:GNAT family N-acetyltransferase [Mucilaginibacter sp.]
MFIRLAALPDIPQILQFIADIIPAMHAEGNFQWDDTYPNTGIFENDIALNQLWVAEADGDIAGVAAFLIEQEPEYAQANWDVNEEAVVIHRLAVSIHHRGKRVAAKLMEQAEQVAISKNIQVLRVDTNATNTPAQQLFPKLGYTFAGEIGLEFRPGQRFYCYEKRLGN